MDGPSLPNKKAVPARKWPLFQGLLPIDKSRLSTDIMAGITLAALGIPEVMGYTKIINMPVVTGLYTLLLPMLVFALFGSSRHLVVAADSATAAIVAAALITLGIPNNSASYIESVRMIAILAGGMLLLARIFRIGFIADFMSRTVLVGFLTGVGFQVAFGELPHVLGFEKGGSHHFIGQLIYAIRNIPQTSHASLIISAIAIGVIVLFEKFYPRFPGSLLVVIGMVVASATFNWASHGVSVIGTVPGGLPAIGLPAITWPGVLKLLPVSFSCFIVILAQSAATSRAYAIRYRDRFSENVDLVGLALANFSAGCSHTFVVNGSPTKSAMVEDAGGRSQVSQLATIVVVVAVLLFVTKPLSLLPNAVLASIVLLIGVKLIDIKGLKNIYQAKPGEFALALVTAATVIGVGVEQGILLAIVLSLLQHVRKSYQPNTGLIQHDPVEKWRIEKITTDGFIEPGMVMYWFGAELFYANANHFSREIRQIVSETKPKIHWLAVDTGTLSSVDYSAGLTIKELNQDLAGMNVMMVLVRINDDLKQDLDELGLTELFGKERMFYSREACLDAFRQVHKEHSTDTNS